MVKALGTIVAAAQISASDQLDVDAVIGNGK